MRFSSGSDPGIYFWRDNVGTEVDIAYEDGQELKAVEIKSGKTFAPEFASGLESWMRYAGAKAEDCSVVYAGERALYWKGISFVPWHESSDLI